MAFAQASPRTPLESSGFLRRAGGDADAAEHRAGFFPGASAVGRSSVDLTERRRHGARVRAGRKQGMFVGRHAIEVGWGDCDPARIVFFPRYFEWFEICTTALFRGAGLPLHAMFAARNMVGIPLLDVGARFHFGSGYGHILEVESRVVEWKAKTFRVEHRFFRDGGLAVEGHEVRVWAVPDPTGEKPMRAAPIPPDVVARFMDQRVESA